LQHHNPCSSTAIEISNEYTYYQGSHHSTKHCFPCPLPLTSIFYITQKKGGATARTTRNCPHPFYSPNYHCSYIGYEHNTQLPCNFYALASIPEPRSVNCVESNPPILV
jgi:hypothetical protein